MSAPEYQPPAPIADRSQPGAVLYVDDERGNRVLFKRSMAGRFDVRIVSSAAEALDLLAREHIDVLVTDNRMPGMTGVQLCQSVAKAHPHVQRIIVTGYADVDSAISAINQGGVARYLRKPWDLEELCAVVRDAQAEAVRARLSRELQTEILLRERMSALAAMRGRVLHDLANAASRLDMSAAELRDLVAGCAALRGTDDEQAFLAELHDLDVTVRFLTDLHLRVRGLNRSDEPLLEVLGVVDMLHGATVLANSSVPAGGRVDIEGDPEVRVLCDRTDLGRILLNLLTNAAQALAEARVPEGRIAAVVTARDDRVLVDVIDNGPGVPAELAERVFEESFTTRGDRGSGLGLAISRRLARANGGELALIQEDRRGAHFRLTLQLAPVAQSTANLEPPDSAPVR